MPNGVISLEHVVQSHRKGNYLGFSAVRRRGQTPGIVASPLPERKPLRQRLWWSNVWNGVRNAAASNQRRRAPRPHSYGQMNRDGQSASLRLLFPHDGTLVRRTAISAHGRGLLV
jgi:hypothetical protein